MTRTTAALRPSAAVAGPPSFGAEDFMVGAAEAIGRMWLPTELWPSPTEEMPRSAVAAVAAVAMAGGDGDADEAPLVIAARAAGVMTAGARGR